MALCFVKALDGEDIAADLGNQLNTHCDRIVSLSVDEVSENCQLDKTCVVAVIVTPLMLKSLKDFTNTGIKPVLDKTGHNIFLYKGCASSAVKEISDRINKSSQNSVAVAEHFELIDDDDHDKAELKLKKMIRKARNENFSRPSARKFIIDPENVTEGSVEVKIILLGDVKSYTDIKVHIPTVSGGVSPKKLREGVWALKVPALGPGEHTIKVIGDGTDLGTARLKSVTKVKALFGMLPAVVRSSPIQFLSELFKLNETDFDNELVDFIADNTESSAVFKCIDLILETGGEKETCLHFCAKHNLPQTCKRILDRRHNPSMRNLADASGKTPIEIAEDKGFEHVKQILQKCDEMDDIQPLPSPIRKKSITDEPEQHRPRSRKTSGSVSSESIPESIPEDPLSDDKPASGHARLQRAKSDGLRTKRQSKKTRSAPVLGRDSGNGSSGSRDTQDGEPRTLTMDFEDHVASGKMEKSFKFKRAEHMYDEINVFESKTNEVNLRTGREHPYNQPWENEDPPSGSMPAPYHERTSSTNL